LIKVSQSVSGKIVLEKLLDTLMRITIEQAGTERALLVVARGTELHVEAQATTSGKAVIVRLEQAPASNLPYLSDRTPTDRRMSSERDRHVVDDEQHRGRRPERLMTLTWACVRHSPARCIRRWPLFHL